MSDGPEPAARSQSPFALGHDGKTLHPTLVEGEVRVLGHRWSPRVHEIKAFLARSRVRYRWFDVERDQGAAGTAEHLGAESSTIP